MKKLLMATSVAVYLTISSYALADSPNVLFILDGSGSMWGRLDNVEKIVIAKDVMKELVSDLPAGVKIGLEVYGHRRKADCSDIETLVPLGRSNRTTIVQQIESISPKGKTPITQSIELAVRQLETLEEETTIVLVSDGKETCERDPCSLVKNLKEKGINLVVHVVGLDVTEAEREQLSCIAEAGGGKYFSAQNSTQLKDAFTEVKTKIIEKVETSEGERNFFGSIKEIPFGLVGNIYFLEPETQRLPNFSQLKPVGSIYTTKIDIPTRRFDKGFPGITDRFEWFAIDYQGNFSIEKEGDFRFRLTSDDGSKLLIDEIPLINNDGLHPTESQEASIYLNKGIHKIRVQYFQGPRFEVALVLEMTREGRSYEIFDLEKMPPTSELRRNSHENLLNVTLIDESDVIAECWGQDLTDGRIGRWKSQYPHCILNDGGGDDNAIYDGSFSMEGGKLCFIMNNLSTKAPPYNTLVVGFKVSLKRGKFSNGEKTMVFEMDRFNGNPSNPSRKRCIDLD